MKSYQYYPGCSLHASARDYDESIQLVASLLNIDLKEVDDWNCCGATVTPSLNKSHAQILAARNLAQASKKQNELIVPCNACYANLKKLQIDMESCKKTSQNIEKILRNKGLSLSGMPTVKHLLEIILDDIGLDNLQGFIKNQLKGLKVGCYYGCQIVRPVGFDSPENPSSLDSLMRVLGAETVDFSHKTHCCGGSLITTQPELALKMVDDILQELWSKDVDLVIVTCPMCQLNLDAYQVKVNKKYQRNYQLPIVYFTQILGLALGIPVKKLGLNRGIVSSKKFLQRVNDLGIKSAKGGL